MADEIHHVHRQACPSEKLPLATQPYRLDVIRSESITLRIGRQPSVFIAEHIHGITQVAFVHGADCEVVSRAPGKRAVVQRLDGDQVWILPPGHSHAVRLRREAHLIICDLDPDWSGKVAGAVVGHVIGAPLTHYVQRNPLITDLIRELRHEWETGLSGSHEHMATLGTSLGSCVLRAHGAWCPAVVRTRRLPQDLEDRIRSFVAEHLQRQATSAEDLESVQISPGVLARAACLSPDHFSRRWKVTTGLTPEQFLHQARLGLARELLRIGQYTVSQVADRTGFSDHSYFSLQFKQRFGLTPREYMLHHLARAS